MLLDSDNEHDSTLQQRIIWSKMSVFELRNPDLVREIECKKIKTQVGCDILLQQYNMLQ